MRAPPDGCLPLAIGTESIDGIWPSSVWTVRIVDAFPRSVRRTFRSTRAKGAHDCAARARRTHHDVLPVNFHLLLCQFLAIELQARTTRAFDDVHESSVARTFDIAAAARRIPS